MAADAQRTDSDPEAKANHYMREAWQNGKSLKNSSAQRIGSGLIAVLQRTIKPMIGAEQQTTTCLQATRVQQTDHSLMAMLQRTAMPRVIACWQTNLNP